MVHLTIVKTTHRKEDNDPNSLVDGDVNKSIASSFTADNILDQVNDFVHTIVISFNIISRYNNVLYSM